MKRREVLKSEERKVLDEWRRGKQIEESRGV